jgi:hypothetical protein
MKSFLPPEKSYVCNKGSFEPTVTIGIRRPKVNRRIPEDAPANTENTVGIIKYFSMIGTPGKPFAPQPAPRHAEILARKTKQCHCKVPTFSLCQLRSRDKFFYRALSFFILRIIHTGIDKARSLE